MGVLFSIFSYLENDVMSDYIGEYIQKTFFYICKMLTMICFSPIGYDPLIIVGMPVTLIQITYHVVANNHN